MPDEELRAGDGTVLARFRSRDDEGVRVAAELRPEPGVPVARVAAQALRDLAGQRLETPDDDLAAALGVPLERSATELRHDLADLPEPVALPAGWTLAEAGWDDDLAEAAAAAYPPGHPDGGWSENDTTSVRDMFERNDPVPPLASASARLVDPDGRSAGHVLCAGPVPWTDNTCAWMLNIAVGPRAQGRGFGRALLTYALHGTRAAGLPSLDLSVADGNPARRLYDAAGFRPVVRVLTVHLPEA
ncbi:Acetyltransferase (GNAT) family protein [Asanoa hainanensis]|uniref:Acetyltransferase (GNAT) family protein n=1 Tax=Asanoa hainanensis TaxID=560556 RepID=A0A239L4T2_9ACTN|nr:GNAT family N-acetyltransferase [Asanoa hainanensis]SNT25451.1 Acetyltransferase (GNAT) family protein [Asanoa hainanensis]